MKIGSRVKNIRLHRRMILKELAQKTGVTKSFLSQLERNLTFPSVRSLEKIARALDVKMAYFFEDKESKELIFVKRGTGKKLINKEKEVLCQTLASDLLNIGMLPYIFNIGKDAEITKELACAAGEKFGMVLKGELKFIFSKENLVLKEGDSIYCSNIKMPYKVVNLGRRGAKLLWVVLRMGLDRF